MPDQVDELFVDAVVDYENESFNAGKFGSAVWELNGSSVPIDVADLLF